MINSNLLIVNPGNVFPKCLVLLFFWVYQADYKTTSKWEVVNVTAAKRLLPSPEENPNFAVLTFDMHLRRRMVFATYMLTLPCVFLACLTLVVFWLPPERPDRTTLGE